MAKKTYPDGSICIFCKQEIHDVKPKPEHVMLAGLGGKLEAIRIICNICNNDLGSIIDKPFLESFAFFRNALQIKSENLGRPPIVKSSDKNASYWIDSDKKPVMKAQRQEIVLDDGGYIITCIDREPQKACIRLLQEAKGKNAITAAEFDELKNEFIRNGNDFTALLSICKKLEATGKVKFSRAENKSEITSETFKGKYCVLSDEIRRAVGKIIFEYFAVATDNIEIMNPRYDGFRDFVRNGTSLDSVRLHERHNKPHAVLEWPFANSVWIMCDPDKNNVVGFFRLFGAFEYCAILAREWSGEKKCYYWATNPRGKESREEVFTDFEGIDSTLFDQPQRGDALKEWYSVIQKEGIDMSLKTKVHEFSELFYELADYLKSELSKYNYKDMTPKEQSIILETAFNKLQTFIKATAEQQKDA